MPPYEVWSLIDFSAFRVVQLHSTIVTPVLELFCHPKIKLPFINSHVATPYFLQSLISLPHPMPSLLSPFIDLPNLGLLYK